MGFTGWNWTLGKVNLNQKGFKMAGKTYIISYSEDHFPYIPSNNQLFIWIDHDQKSDYQKPANVGLELTEPEVNVGIPVKRCYIL